MTRGVVLAGRLREVFINGTWIANTNYKLQLDDITWKEATTQIENLNSIALLTFHINYYLKGLIQVFEGGSLDIRDKYSFDMPPIQSETEWKVLAQDFLSNAEIFAQYVEKMDDHALDQSFVDIKYGSYERNIEAIIEHSYYHLGQISLIKKMIRNNYYNNNSKT